MKKFNVKALSFILMLLLVVNFVMPTTIFATSPEVPEDYVPSENTVEESIPEGVKEPKDPAELQRELDELTYEITALRDENTKHFHLSDGTYQAVVYGESVHRLNDNGEWEEIDNSLAPVNGAISTKDSRVKFAKKIAGNESLYTIHNGHYKVTVGLIGAKKKVEGVITNNSVSEEGMTKLQRLMNIDNISSSITYSDILDGVDLEYVLVSNSIKENIIVKEHSESYTYTFTLDLNGLIAKLENGSILLCDSSSEKTVYRIPAPFMYDAAGNESFEAFYTLTDTNNGKYEFTLSADAEWINSSERSFPVVIDPSLVDIGQTDDTYVDSISKSQNYGGTHALVVSSLEEVYYKFATPTLPSGTTITQATVSFPYYFDSTSGSYASLGLYQITSNWNEDQVTWNTKPTTSSSYLNTIGLSASGPSASNPSYASFLVKNYVSSWYTGTSNYGFALKYISGTESSVKFVAKEKMQKFAQLTIKYSGTHLAEGIYAIERDGADYYFKSYIPNNLAWIYQDTEHTSPPLTTSDLENLFKISYRPANNDYVIRSMLDSSLLVYPSVYNNAPVAGRRSESDEQLSIAFTWKIESINGYYYITYTESGIKYYVRSESTENNHKLVFTTNINATGTQWDFHQYTGNVYEDIEMEKIKSSITVGEEFQYQAYMRSTRIGHNGPVTYSVRGSDGGTTTLATINSTTGLLSPTGAGVIQVRATYAGAPWVWLWNITIKTAGCKPYYHIEAESEESMSMNCQGYAFWTHDKPFLWMTTPEVNAINTLTDSNDALYGVSQITGVKELLEENWLDSVFPGKWEQVTSEDGGWDVSLNDNQWLVAFRVGYREVYNSLGIDYHFWYRTDEGEWVNKHGFAEDSSSERLGDDLPTNDDSIGWNLGTIRDYDSDVIYYVLTE